MSHVTMRAWIPCSLFTAATAVLPACQEPTAATEAPAAQAATSGCAGLELRLVAPPSSDVPGAEVLEYRGDSYRLEPGACFAVENARVEKEGPGYTVQFEIVSADHARFRAFTAAHVDRGMAALAGGEVVTIATIKTALPPKGLLQGTTADAWTRERAEAIAAALRPRNR
jgi:preprotein translocase subunit SecD